MNLTPRTQLLIGLALALLMAMTRGQHFATLNLPSASWAVFFLAGVLLALVTARITIALALRDML